MNRSRRNLLSSFTFIAAFMLLTALPALGATIPLTGSVTFADPDPNSLFGVAAGDAVTGFTIFNSNLVLANPNAVLSPIQDPTMLLGINLGNALFSEADDLSYPSAPELTFSGGSLSNIDFRVLFDFAGMTVDPFGSTYSFTLLDGMFEIQDFDTGNLIVAGNLAPVPLPASVLLMGSGLAGLIGLRRRRD